jgi:hypothetical protein
VFKKVQEVGSKFASHLKKGDIEPLRKRKSPSNTWTFKKLEEYKEYLKTGKTILYGSFINPTGKDDMYDYSMYALNIDTDDKPLYFYTLSVIVSAKDDEYKVLNFMIFTERKALDAWWNATFGFFISDEFKKIPKSVIKPDVCPPPPNFNK